MKRDSSTQWEPFSRADVSVQTGHVPKVFGKGLQAKSKLFGRNGHFVSFTRLRGFGKCLRLQTDKIENWHKSTQTDENDRLSTAPGPQYIPSPKFLLETGVSSSPQVATPARGAEVFIPTFLHILSTLKLPKEKKAHGVRIILHSPYVPLPVKARKRVAAASKERPAKRMHHTSPEADSELYELCKLLEGMHADQLYNSIQRVEFQKRQDNLLNLCYELELECRKINLN
ncbi:hypothetical protein QAD02_021193 [Eretmocerus hayati]|uniref:Uncharacterized protein n=1 Tax=Eretmocerus hayati TaxID=131215 RepID=A0ACC2PPR8_9HYME|nr:hypothetical protein QAD02_021193 [Eretmocerus hayati]